MTWRLGLLVSKPSAFLLPSLTVEAGLADLPSPDLTHLGLPNPERVAEPWAFHLWLGPGCSGQGSSHPLVRAALAF